MLKKLSIVIVIICFAASVSIAQKKTRTRRESAGDKLITALINAQEVRGIFADDAMYLYTTAPEIQEIFALGSKAVPLLIAHLDDKRLIGVSTSMSTFDKTEEYTVTIGAACFDLLTYIIREDARFFDKSCLDDLREASEGHSSSCAKNKYAVFPWDFWATQKQDDRGIWQGQTLIVKPSVRHAKRNWQAAYQKNWIRYIKFEG